MNLKGVQYNFEVKISQEGRYVRWKIEDLNVLAVTGEFNEDLEKMTKALKPLDFEIAPIIRKTHSELLPAVRINPFTDLIISKKMGGTDSTIFFDGWDYRKGIEAIDAVATEARFIPYIDQRQTIAKVGATLNEEISMYVLSKELSKRKGIETRSIFEASNYVSFLLVTRNLQKEQAYRIASRRFDVPMELFSS